VIATLPAILAASGVMVAALVLRFLVISGRSLANQTYDVNFCAFYFYLHTT